MRIGSLDMLKLVAPESKSVCYAVNAAKATPFAKKGDKNPKFCPPASVQVQQSTLDILEYGTKNANRNAALAAITNL